MPVSSSTVFAVAAKRDVPIFSALAPDDSSEINETDEANEWEDYGAPGIYRKTRNFSGHTSIYSGFVTSLSDDMQDEPPLRETSFHRKGLFMDMGNSDKDEAAPILNGQEENSSVSSSSVLIDGTNHVSKAPQHHGDGDGEGNGGDGSHNNPLGESFVAFRVNNIVVTVAIMLADALQGTHLYVLYEGYGFSVASLYCLGFLTGAVTSPITGPLVDRMGRKKAALVYCVLEVGINILEQHPVLVGLVASRMIGGVTTNLLASVFETWLDTEYRRRGYSNEEYEIIMRDSVVVSNLAAIASGYLAHGLAESMGPVGPFKGAVTCTAIAFSVVAVVWTENYGSADSEGKSVKAFLSEAVQTFRSDSKVLRVGLIQGLTTSTIQIFIFLWSPVLRQFASNAIDGTIGLDKAGEPAYGLIFSAFMAAGVVGGLASPIIRKAVAAWLTPVDESEVLATAVESDQEDARPVSVEILAASCYILCAGLLVVPCITNSQSESAFVVSLAAFLIYEFILGIYMPCEGVIRSIYIPSDARCSIMTMPRVIVNVAVSLGVVSTRYVSLSTALMANSFLMVVAATIQLSLVSAQEWATLCGRTRKLRRRISSVMSFRSDGSSGSITEKKKER